MQNSRYIPFVQQKRCCVPACIQMILYRRNIPLISQESIGNDLGLIVPPEHAELFERVKSGPQPESGYGTQVSKEQYSLNNFFKKNKLNLKETYYYIDEINIDVKEWIENEINKDSDILVCFNAKFLNGQGNDGGHVLLIDRLIGNDIILMDPSSGYPKYRKIALDKLIEAIEYHGKKKRGGFWVISKL